MEPISMVFCYVVPVVLTIIVVNAVRFYFGGD